MFKYQVTAQFGNIFEVVGNDEVNEVEAHRLFNLYKNVGRPVRMWLVCGNGSRIIQEGNM